MPDILIDGVKAKAHSQGLYVTDKHYLVTGRLETKPKRPMLFRFLRSDVSKYEVIGLAAEGEGNVSLNHPGGFDRDTDGVYWIPISTSNPKGPTLIYGMKIDDDQPLAKATTLHKLAFDDHLGALCCVDDLLLVASWDTKTIYWLDRTGKVQRKADRSEFIEGQPDWFLAVQDWKYDREKKRVVAGGLDKSKLAKWKRGEGPRPNTPATLAWIDLKAMSVRTEVLAPKKNFARPLTNEGMAWFDGDLFLLPEDLGAGAKILRVSK